MSSNTTPSSTQPCSRHDYMNFCGWYDAASDKYLHSCHDVQCPRHGVGACRQSYHRKLKALRPGWGFATFIIFFNMRPSPNEVKAFRNLVRTAVRSWDREARICMPLHPKDGKWHLNVGILSKWLFKMSNRHWWGQYVNDRVAGWWDGKRMRYPRGAPRKADFQAMMKKLELDLVDLCASSGLKRPRPPRLRRGRFRNQPKRWLWYILRCKAGWSADEQLPRKRGYRLVSGFINRGRKQSLSSAAPQTPSPTPTTSTGKPCSAGSEVLPPHVLLARGDNHDSTGDEGAH